MIYRDRQVIIVILAFVALHGAAVFLFPLLPFIDLPNHLAEATIFKHQGAPGNVIYQYYRPSPWFFPNTFHTVFGSWFSDVETGNKVFHLLCIFLLCSSLYLVTKVLGGNTWYSLLGLLFTYNYNLTYGFVGFAISIPTLLFLFYLIILDSKTEKIWIKIAISVTLVLLFFMHAQNALLALLMYGLMMLYRYRQSLLKFCVNIITVPVPLVALILGWWFSRGSSNEESTLRYLINYYSSDYFSTFDIRFRLFVLDNFQLNEGFVGIAMAAFFFLCLVIPLLWFKVWRRYRKDEGLSIERVYALIFATVVTSCYLFLPDKLPGQSPLFQRFCTIVMLSFIIGGSLAMKHVMSGSFRYFVIALLTVYSACWIEYLYTFNVENKSFDKTFFSKLSNKDRLAGLIYDNKYRGRKVYIHFPNYFVVWNQGIAASKIIDYRFGVVRRVAAESKLPFYNELVGDRYKPLNLYHDLEYLLVRGRAPVAEDKNLKGFKPLKQSGKWQLYKNISLPHAALVRKGIYLERTGIDF